MPEHGFYQMSPFEVATGWLTGELAGAAPNPDRPSTASPVEALDSVLTPALARPPCVIAFSGGRDSSALLAVAARLAAREGLPAPVAATLRYPGEHDAHEERWQELVVRHLRLPTWEKVDGTDAADLLGPVATEGLRRHGVLWPPAHHTIVPLVRLAAGGTLVTGDGGDEVLGARRITPIVRLFKGHCPSNKGEALEAVFALAPRPVRERAYCRSLRGQLTRSWLRPDAQADFAQALATDEAADPLSWRDSLRRLPRMRAWHLGFHNQDLVAEEEGTVMLRPLQEAGFLTALAHGSPTWGFPDRDTAMSELFGSLLPEELIRRPTKATFNRVVFGDHSRAFVDGWTGAGVPKDLVDPDALLRFWRAPVPHALSLTLLQSAWLAHARGRGETAAYQGADPLAHFGR